MKTKYLAILVCTALLALISLGAAGAAAEGGNLTLTQEYDLVGNRSLETQYYLMERDIRLIAEDGTPKGGEKYRLRLMIEPGDRSLGEADKYTCREFTLQIGDGAEVTIPALEGWSFDFERGSLDEAMLDEQGLFFGIPHTRFEGLSDSSGKVLEPINAYQIYDVFIGFLSFNGYAEPDPRGRGIQDLRRIGDKIVRPAGSESPISLGDTIKEGSTFKGGGSTLEFKGLSLVDGAPCAILSYETGMGSFTMTFEVMPGMEVTSFGVTYITADIYLDLSSKWMKKAEIIVVDSTKAILGDQVIDRSIVQTINTIKAVSEAEFRAL